MLLWGSRGRTAEVALASRGRGRRLVVTLIVTGHWGAHKAVAPLTKHWSGSNTLAGLRFAGGHGKPIGGLLQVHLNDIVLEVRVEDILQLARRAGRHFEGDCISFEFHFRRGRCKGRGLNHHLLLLHLLLRRCSVRMRPMPGLMGGYLYGDGGMGDPT